MRQNEDRGKAADVMELVLWFFGGYLCGCVAMNMYWRFSDRLASYAFRISVYEDAYLRISGDDLFWRLIRRDFGILSILFPAGLFSWGNILICGILSGGGFILGVLTSGILLTEGVYWWIRGILWMMPCLLCSGSVLAGEMYSVWKGTYRLGQYRRPPWKHLLSYVGHILLVSCLTAMVCRAESIVLLSVFAKK